VPFGPLHPLPLRHQLTLVFVMSAGEGHHVVFLAPSSSFLPQSKFVLLFDLNTYPWLWTRESGGSKSKERTVWGRHQDLDSATFWCFSPVLQTPHPPTSG
jgi:hypothetical protein